MIGLRRSAAAFFAIVLLGIGAFYSTAPSHTAENYKARVELESIKQPFQGEAVLVTSATEPLRFRCRVHLEPEVPENYTPKPIHYQWHVDSGQLKGSRNEVTWVGAEPGVRTLTVSGTLRYEPPQSLNLFSSMPTISVPFEAVKQCVFPKYVPEIKGGKVDGFEVGYYPNPSNPNHLRTASTPNRIMNHAEAYQPPQLFYKVTPQTFFLPIFNQYRLGEFSLDPRFFKLDYPRYIAVHPNLLRKLELLRDLMQQKGHPVTKFKFIYAFRSPAYNRQARQRDGEDTLKASFSMHMYGKAVDMIVDEDNDLVMDDLNGDGKISIQDADVLFDFVYELDKQLLEQGSELIGGRGLYYHHDYYERGEVAQTPYVHMDVRGFTREDGTLIWWKDQDKIGVTKQENPYRLKKPVPPYPW